MLTFGNRQYLWFGCPNKTTKNGRCQSRAVLVKNRNKLDSNALAHAKAQVQAGGGNCQVQQVVGQVDVNQTKYGVALQETNDGNYGVNHTKYLEVKAGVLF